MTISNDDEDECKRQESCPNCGSSNRQPDHSHHYCSDCGWELDQLDADPGFAPANSDPGGLRARASGRSRNGTTISLSAAAETAGPADWPEPTVAPLATGRASWTR